MIGSGCHDGGGTAGIVAVGDGATMCVGDAVTVGLGDVPQS